LPDTTLPQGSGMYDQLAGEYDRFVNWPARLAYEIPFLAETLRRAGAQRVLDAACGTGMHAIALAEQGFSVAGADFSAGMVARARANAAQAAVDARFDQAGFGELARTFGAGGFDALVCLGNSLPHAETLPGVTAALRDFASCLRPGGLLILQNRNFDAILARRERWLPLQTWKDGPLDRLFLRFYDFETDGALTFWMILLRRETDGKWVEHRTSARLFPLRQESLLSALADAGFGRIHSQGDPQGTDFDAERSSDLWIQAIQQDGEKQKDR
jgi:glycine/sarcosine N-methyltransferase